MSIFPLILQRDIVSINRLTVILRIISHTHYDIIDKVITSVLNILTYIITTITVCPVGLCDTRDIVCLDFQNCRYSILTFIKMSSYMMNTIN